MAQAVRRQLLTVQARVHAQVTVCGIYVGQSGTGTDSSLSHTFLISPKRAI
jgi:hypothetical protein